MLNKEYINPVYLVELIYKNGATIRYWFKSFTINDGKAEWTLPGNATQLMFINIDNVDSIHQLSVKELDDLNDQTDTRLEWEK